MVAGLRVPDAYLTWGTNLGRLLAFAAIVAGAVSEQPGLLIFFAALLGITATVVLLPTVALLTHAGPRILYRSHILGLSPTEAIARLILSSVAFGSMSTNFVVAAGVGLPIVVATCRLGIHVTSQDLSHNAERVIQRTAQRRGHESDVRDQVRKELRCIKEAWENGLTVVLALITSLVGLGSYLAH